MTIEMTKKELLELIKDMDIEPLNKVAQITEEDLDE